MRHEKDLIAPCGMYCGICDKYLAYSHQLPRKRGKIGYCKGCRPANKNCSFVKKKCVTGKIYVVDFCFECEVFPCDILKKISKKQKERNQYDIVESLYRIQEHGLDWFIEEQVRIHGCDRCGDMICVHNDKCYSCDQEELIA